MLWFQYGNGTDFGKQKKNAPLTGASSCGCVNCSTLPKSRIDLLCCFSLALGPSQMAGPF